MYLSEIIEYKKEEIKDVKVLERVRSREIIPPGPCLKEKPFISEIKRASPSMGDISSEIDIIHQARLYEKGGAGAISVLTDEKYFKGGLDFLTMVSDNLSLPVLCKDFILSEIQVENAYRAGADFILLIAAILTGDELRRLAGAAQDRELAILYEIHELKEFDKIECLDPEIVGVNSRDLRSFAIDKGKAQAIIRQLRGNFLKIAESGIESVEDIKLFKEAGADGFLIGTSLMKSDNPVKTLENFYEAAG
jgi:indole-3-glycerol phosphate synthase